MHVFHAANFDKSYNRKPPKEEYSSETTKALPLLLAAGPNPDETWQFILNSNNQTGEAFSLIRRVTALFFLFALPLLSQSNRW